MGFWDFFRPKKPDIVKLKERKDIRGLVRALRHWDYDTQWQAADALGKLGSDAVDHLISTLRDINTNARIGAIEALGEIKNKRAAPPLIHLLDDESAEVRWATALALGEIGDARAMKFLLKTLTDPDKYVRYGTALALEKMGWYPSNEAEWTYLFVAKQEWGMLRNVGEQGTSALIPFLKDKDKEVRIKVIEVLGASSEHKVHEHCSDVLSDENPAVRWKAILTSLRCGVPHIQLPWGVSKRPKRGRNPYIVSLINFVNPGQGYTYTDAWWGIVLWNIYTLSVLVTLYFKHPLGFPVLPEPFFWFYTVYGWLSPEAWRSGANVILFPFPIITTIHVWFRAKRMQEL